MKVMTPLNGHIEKVMAPHYGQWTLQIQSQKKILMHIYKFKDTPGSSAKTLNWKPLKAIKVLYYIYIVLSVFLFFFLFLTTPGDKSVGSDLGLTCTYRIPHGFSLEFSESLVNWQTEF